MELNEILAEAVRNEASDVLLKVGVPPAFRVRADFLPLEGAEPLDAAALQRIVDGVLDDNRRRRLEQDALDADIRGRGDVEQTWMRICKLPVREKDAHRVARVGGAVIAAPFLPRHRPRLVAPAKSRDWAA